MPDTVLVVSLDSATVPIAHDAEKQRWDAWQQRGVARDARNRGRMGVVIAVVVLALAGMFGLILLGAS